MLDIYIDQKDKLPETIYDQLDIYESGAILPPLYHQTSFLLKMPLDPKSVKAASTQVTTEATTAIKAGACFSISVVDLKTSDGYGTMDEVDEALTTMLTKTLKPRVIPGKVLEKMRQQGKEPSPSPSDIVVVIIANSENHVHIAARISNKLGRLPDEEIKFMIRNYLHLSYKNVTAVHVPGEDICTVVSQSTNEAFKARDWARKEICDQMKIIGIVPEDDDESDEEPAFNLNDL